MNRADLIEALAKAEYDELWALAKAEYDELWAFGDGPYDARSERETRVVRGDVRTSVPVSWMSTPTGLRGEATQWSRGDIARGEVV